MRKQKKTTKIEVLSKVGMKLDETKHQSAIKRSSDRYYCGRTNDTFRPLPPPLPTEVKTPFVTHHFTLQSSE